MTDYETWDALVADWQEKHDAVASFPLFQAGMMQTDKLGELDRLLKAERAARGRMDDFLAKVR